MKINEKNFQTIIVEDARFLSEESEEQLRSMLQGLTIKDVEPGWGCSEAPSEVKDEKQVQNENGTETETETKNEKETETEIETKHKTETENENETSSVDHNRRAIGKAPMA